MKKWIAWKISIAEKKFCVGLLRNGGDKLCGAALIQRHDDRAVQTTTPEGGGPLRTVFSAQQYTVTRDDTTRRQLPRKTIRFLYESLIRPAHRAEAALVHKNSRAAALRVIVKVT